MIGRATRLSTAVVAGLAMFGMADSSQAALTLYYDFQEGSGTTAIDRSGNGRNGVFTPAGTGTVSYVESPAGLTSSTPSRALDFAGGTHATVPPGGYVESGQSAAALNINGAKPKTISAWARAESFATNSGVWEVGNNGGGREDFSLRTRTETSGTLPGGTDAWRAQFWGGDVDFAVPGSLNNWVHFAITYDPGAADQDIKIYANGAVVGTLEAALNTGIVEKTFRVGRWSTNDAATEYAAFNGQIDDVAVFDQALTAAQVQSLTNGASPTTVPEPGSLGVLAAAGAAVFLRRRRVSRGT